MAGELTALWMNENQPQYEINAANLTFMSPSVMCMSQRILQPVTGQRRQVQLSGDLYIKLVTGGIHRAYKNTSALVFDPQTLLDSGSTFENGKDYYLFIVQNGGTADIVCSLNTTFPIGATADNSRKIGGFHTLCADIGAQVLSGHPLTGYLAGDILPQSIWDLKFRPECSPEGMVFDPNTNAWIDIYMQSGSGVNTRSAFAGTVTKNQTYDTHQIDLFSVGKRMMLDHEFTSAATGTQPLVAVAGSADPITTGGKVNTAGNRIVSNIGCEDMCGCYRQWMSETYYYTGSAWTNIAPTGQGSNYGPSSATVAGGYWGDTTYNGPRSRTTNTRSDVLAYNSSRGAARALGLA